MEWTIILGKWLKCFRKKIVRRKFKFCFYFSHKIQSFDKFYGAHHTPIREFAFLMYFYRWTYLQDILYCNKKRKILQPYVWAACFQVCVTLTYYPIKEIYVEIACNMKGSLIHFNVIFFKKGLAPKSLVDFFCTGCICFLTFAYSVRKVHIK